MNETEKRFEEFIESYLVSEDGGWTKATDAGSPFPMGENKGAAGIVGEYSKKAGTMVHLTEL